VEEEYEPTTGWVDEGLHAEFPELRLRAVTIDAVPGRRSDGLRLRLRSLSDRFRGAQAVALRQEPIPHAYRVFYRHVGLDPDADRVPIEAAVVERLIAGQFRSQNIVDDALTIALVETGVPIWALDADSLDGPIGLRGARPGEALGTGEKARPLPEGRLVVADAEHAVAILFGDVDPRHVVTKQTTRMTLFALQVAGVPVIHVEEALHTSADAIATA